MRERGEMVPATRILFLMAVPPKQRDHMRLGAAELAAAGLGVELWDFSPLLEPPRLQAAPDPEPPGGARVRRFAERGAACRELAALGPADFAVVLFPPTSRSLPLFRSLARSAARIGSINLGALPTVQAGRRRRFAGLLRARPGRLLDAAVARLPLTSLGLRQYDFYMIGGERALSNRLVGRGTQIIRGGCLDYDVWLARRAAAPGPWRGAAVFLDAYLPYHPDFVRAALPSLCSAEEYFASMVRFFDRLEAALSVPVVIAAHPHSHYEEGPDRFGGRPVIKGATQDLVRDAGLVMAHFSTALNFAVLHRRPVLLLTTKAVESYSAFPFAGYVRTLAAALDCVLLNADAEEPLDAGRLLRVNSEAYDAYCDAYIKCPGSPEKPTWEIFADWVRMQTGA